MRAEPAPFGPPLLTIDHLAIELGGRVILTDVSTILRRGQITSLIGLNGSGKTTILRCILGECNYQGSIRFDGLRIGYVPQKLLVDGRLPLTVRDFLALLLQRRPLFFGSSRRIRQQMHDVLHRVGALNLMDASVAKLSGGELQRVLLGVAMEPIPDLLLLDEPAAGIDFKDQQGFYELISEFNRKHNVAILLVSHELSVVDRHSHHVLCLRDGRIQCQGPPSQVLTESLLADTFGGDKSLFSHHGHHS